MAREKDLEHLRKSQAEKDLLHAEDISRERSKIQNPYMSLQPAPGQSGQYYQFTNSFGKTLPQQYYMQSSQVDRSASVNLLSHQTPSRFGLGSDVKQVEVVDVVEVKVDSGSSFKNE